MPIVYEFEYFESFIVSYSDSEICNNSIYEYLKLLIKESMRHDQVIKLQKYLDISLNFSLIDSKNIACLENDKPYNTGYALYQAANFYLLHIVYK
ncbi:hypothetical protein IGI43_002712 [Enterococcus sp. AZ126]